VFNMFNISARGRVTGAVEQAYQTYRSAVWLDIVSFPPKFTGPQPEPWPGMYLLAV
jgi:hypothetical protein